LEPIDGAAVDYRREHPDSGPKGVTDRTEGKHDVKILLALLNEEAVELGWRSLLQFILVFSDRTHQLHQLRLLLVREEVGHLVGIEEVVDVLHERLVLDLSVGEKEDGRLVFTARLLEDPLQILLPLGLPIGLGDLDLEYLVLADLSSKSG
jgi:hypothetical protein